MLNTLFGYDRPGIYFDIGAHDPVAWSNTKKFSESGWWGLNIDPLPGMAERFQRYRPRDRCLEAAIDIGGNEPLLYWIFDNEPHWNCLAPRAPVNDRDGREFRANRSMSVPVIGIADALAKANLPFVDLLNLNIGGGEDIVLRAWPWERYTPKAICVGLFGQPATGIVRNPLTEYLLRQGMVFASKTTSSVIFLDRSFLATCYPQAHIIEAANAAV